MKIKIEQLNESTRSRVVRALNSWAERNEEFFPKLSSRYKEIALRIKNGELLLCEYIDTDIEKGCNHGL